MEEHRLQPMGNYDPKLFNRLFKETEPLRKRIIAGIDHSRFGIEKQDLMSWLNTKFIFIFNKYQNLDEGNLKGRIIKGLQFYKNRILRYSYTQKNSVNMTTDISLFSSSQFKTEPEDAEHTLDLLLPTFKSLLPPFEYQVFLIDHQPPLYILSRLDKCTKKVPEKLIADFLGLEHTFKAYYQIRQARLNYRKVISLVKSKYSNS